MAQISGNLSAPGSVVLTLATATPLENRCTIGLSGTYGTVTGVIEAAAADGVYQQLAAVRLLDGVILTTTLAPTDNQTVAYAVSVGNFQTVRFRATAVGSGTVAVEMVSGFFSDSLATATPVPGIAIADGADVTEGAIADAIANAGGTGTISAKLRRATQGLEDLKTLIVLAAGTHVIGQVGDNGWGGAAISRGIAGGVPFTSADQSGAPAAVTLAPTSGQKIVWTDLLVSSDTALLLTFTEETTGTVLWKEYTAAGGAWQITPRGKFKLTTADKRIMVQANIAGNIVVLPLYYSEA